MTLALDRRPAPFQSGERLPWRPAADRLRGQVAVLSGTALLCLFSPMADGALRASGGALLLVGGALIGVPHGSSDFVVAHRLMRPTLDRLWLPCFPAGYLALVAMSMAGWAPAPLARLHLLGAWQWSLLPLWDATLALVTLPALSAGGHRALDAAELLAIVHAAAVLPPLLAFELYFCLVHAVRHMLHFAGSHHPGRPRATLGLAPGIVVPSTLACLLALWLSWDGLAGRLGTDAVVTWSLRVIAALTVPHMVPEWWAARSRG